MEKKYSGLFGKKPGRIVVKVGSNVLTRADGSLDVTRMSAIVDQLAALRAGGIEIILISSGAVASGRGEFRRHGIPTGELDEVSSRQLFSAVGQAKLINRYYEFFRDHSIICGQVLATKENLATRRHYLNQKHCMGVMLKAGIIPVVNENDTVSVTELMFTDNDELSGLVASMMDADALIILSNIDGIYTTDPSEPGAELIGSVRTTDRLDSCIGKTRSSLGRGGMSTKYRVASRLAAEGIAVVIANGKREGRGPASRRSEPAAGGRHGHRGRIRERRHRHGHGPGRHSHRLRPRGAWLRCRAASARTQGSGPAAGPRRLSLCVHPRGMNRLGDVYVIYYILSK